ncbi:S41 family peptidase [Fischerella sp. JS2]|uniref:S41 family peptidase n=1 Tax=Fischerella sp. JS2 TaxID=2597771 RepID=UPI0028E8B64B|nr:S41 family peptidase [Fischerella sp. JS2]
MSPEALKYLNEVLGIIQAHSINRESVNWELLQTNALHEAKAAQATSDTYDAIRHLLSQIGNKHSFFLTPTQAKELENETVSHNREPEGKLLEKKIGFILLPEFGCINQQQSNQYASLLQDIIRRIDAEEPCGWIVDLRLNHGGNMWPMLAGIGPVLGEGQVGAFVTPEGQKNYWIYKNGQAKMDNKVYAQVEGFPYILSNPNVPVAVLTSQLTVSSGEAIAIAFRGRRNTRSFGENTGGLSTANEDFLLNDGAMLFLTISTYADRFGQLYGDIVVPDQLVTNQSDSEQDDVLYAAVDWLLKQVAHSRSE